jgi:hypothetical protein
MSKEEDLIATEDVEDVIPKVIGKVEPTARNKWKLKYKANLITGKMDPKTIDRKQLELVDDVYAKSLSDLQLKELHDRLHFLEKEIGTVTEGLQNAHTFVWAEMKRRDLPHNIETPLDHKTSLEVVEYPKPEEGIPQELKEYSLEEVLKLFPEQIVVGDPIHVYLCGGTVNREKILQGHDLDILFKQPYLHKPTIKAFLNELANSNPEIAKDVHFVWDQEGPQIGYSSALYRLAYIRVKPEEMIRKSPCNLSGGPILFKPYIGLKPKSGFEKNEFWDLNDMWQKWAKDRIDVGIAIEEKYDGMRMQIHVDGDKVKIYTEDRQRDRAVAFKKSIEELLKGKKATSFILDAEMVEYACGQIKTNHPELVCKQSPRENQIKWIASSPEKLDDEDIVFNIHDCVFINGKSINDQGYLERWKQISECFPDSLRHWARVPCKVAETQKQFFTFSSELRRKTNAEGIVCKTIDSRYPMKYSGENRAVDWAKLKNLKEIDVMVWKIVQKKTSDGKLLDQYLYDCVFSIPCSDVQKFQATHVVRIGGKCYSHIGRTYSTSVKVHAGDIITVRPIRIAEYKDKNGKVLYTWMFPYFDSKHIGKIEPDSIDVVKKLLDIGTSPLSTIEEDLKSIERLLTCPFFDDENICPLKERFAKPMDELSITKTEYLKYPIVCKLANSFKCRYVKPYYYSIKTIKLNSNAEGIVTDEDDCTKEGVED